MMPANKKMAWSARLRQCPDNERLLRRVEMVLLWGVTYNTPQFRRVGATIVAQVPVPDDSDEFDNPWTAWAAIENLVSRAIPDCRFCQRP